MKAHKFLAVALAALSFGAITLTTKSASAAYIAEGTSRWVTLKRSVTVYKYKIVTPIYKSRSVGTYTAHKGAHYKLYHYGANYEWVLDSGRFNSTSHYTYAVAETGSSWFKLGTGKTKAKPKKATPKTRKFHGYRIETKRYTLENTFYYPSTHATLSDYKPTQKSKVIFEYGNHVIPTKHEWDWIHNDYLTEYRYKNGSWHRLGTTYTGD